MVREEEETIVEEGDKNGEQSWSKVHVVGEMLMGAVLLSIISQLRPGADLSRITLPTFILEPKSMLERITK